MCDTWVALKDASSEGKVIFAKNSDRPIFDCQPLLLRPGQYLPAGSSIHTGYTELPQSEVTYAHLGSSPYWCWGYEEGINEWGVVIGNEAIYTKPLRETVRNFQQGKRIQLGLLGMDLVRIALERCQTSSQAVELIGQLVERYGQFGSGNPGKPHDLGSYDNAFMIADPVEAWVLEAVGQRWAARRFSQGLISISNEPTIRTDWHLGSPDLESYARQKGWWPEPVRGNPPLAFDFAQAYVDEKTSRQVSHMRAMRSRHLLEERRGQVTPQWMMRIARDHYEDTFLQGPYFDAANPDFLSLCMHVSPADFTWGNTASSCVAVLPKEAGDLPVFWWTPGPPCNGCYLPFFPQGSKLPEIVSMAGQKGKKVIPADQVGEDSYSFASYWWLFRQLNDQVKGDPVKSLPGCYAGRNPQVRARFDELERIFSAQLPAVVQNALALKESNPAEMAKVLDDFSASCVAQVLAGVKDLLESFPAIES
jgi:secernin